MCLPMFNANQLMEKKQQIAVFTIWLIILFLLHNIKTRYILYTNTIYHTHIISQYIGSKCIYIYVCVCVCMCIYNGTQIDPGCKGWAMGHWPPWWCLGYRICLSMSPRVYIYQTLVLTMHICIYIYIYKQPC